MTWHQHAACKGMDVDLFYPSENDDRNLRQHARIVYNQARQVCMACPVRVACLDQALADGELSYGMFGGMSPSERRALVRTEEETVERARRARLDARAAKNVSPAARALAEAMR